MRTRYRMPEAKTSGVLHGLLINPGGLLPDSGLLRVNQISRVDRRPSRQEGMNNRLGHFSYNEDPCNMQRAIWGRVFCLLPVACWNYPPQPSLSKFL